MTAKRSHSIEDLQDRYRWAPFPAELALLVGLPPIAITLYLIAIRPLIDWNTGLVGIASDVSWNGLGHWVEVPSRRGFGGLRFSKWALWRAVAWLVDVGLIEVRSDRDGRRLIFYLPVAHKYWHVWKKAARKPARPPKQRPHDLPRGENGEGRTTHLTKAAPKAAKSPYKEFTYVNSSSSSKSPPSKNGHAKLQPADDEEEGREEIQGLVWHADLGEKIRQRITFMLVDHDPEEARLLIAGLAAEIDRRKRIGDPIVRPVKYLATLIADPDFDPTPAMAWLVAWHQRAAKIAAAPAPASPPTRSTPPPEYLAAVAKLKKTR